MRLNRLLIKVGTRSAAPIETIAADGRKWPFSEIWSSFNQRKACNPRSKTSAFPVARPLRIKACASFALSYDSSSSNQHQSGFAFVPQKLHEPAGQRVARLIDKTVSAQSPQVFMDSDQAESPDRGEVNSVKAGKARAKNCPAIIWKLLKGDRPTVRRRAPTTLALGNLPILGDPATAIKAHVIVEAIRFKIERVMKERAAGGGQVRSARDLRPIRRAGPARMKARALSSVQYPFGEIRHTENGVLEDACENGHRDKMISSSMSGVPGSLVERLSGK